MVHALVAQKRSLFGIAGVAGAARLLALEWTILAIHLLFGSSRS
jgi:hypothetical protein